MWCVTHCVYLCLYAAWLCSFLIQWPNHGTNTKIKAGFSSLLFNQGNSSTGNQTRKTCQETCLSDGIKSSKKRAQAHLKMSKTYHSCVSLTLTVFLPEKVKIPHPEGGNGFHLLLWMVIWKQITIIGSITGWDFVFLSVLSNLREESILSDCRPIRDTWSDLQTSRNLWLL